MCVCVCLCTCVLRFQFSVIVLVNDDLGFISFFFFSARIIDIFCFVVVGLCVSS